MEYSEHEKVVALGANKDLVAEFLDFLLDEKKFIFAQWYELSKDHFHLSQVGYGGDSGRETLLAEFFGVDLRKLEEEKRAMVAKLRKESNG